MDLKTFLELMTSYSSIKKVEFFESGPVKSIELKDATPVGQNPQELIKALSSSPDMPPDDVMLFASTPTFDEMVNQKEEQG